MAKLVDILQVEKDRQEEATWAVVHLYKTGSFYSAYEWSAWLIAVITFNDEVRLRTKDRKPLAVTRIKMANSEETFCRVGFPLKSVEKYIPTRLSYDAEDDKHIVISVELPKPTDGTEVTHELGRHRPCQMYAVCPDCLVNPKQHFHRLLEHIEF